MRNTDKTQAQREALAQLRAAFAACEAAGLSLVALGDCSEYAHPVVVSDFDATEDDELVVVLSYDDGRCCELVGDDEVRVEDVEATCEKWLAQLGGDKDNAWPNVVAELGDDYDWKPDYDLAVELARNYFQAV